MFRQHSLKVFAILCFLAFLAFGLAQREVDIAIVSDPESLDPHIGSSSGAASIINHMFDKLVERSPVDMAPVPDLAKSWDIVDDTTYVFHLHEGVSFHNGEPLTASDVVFSFERLLLPEFNNIGKYSEPLIESVEALDDYMVQFNLRAPYAPFLNRMPTFYIVPEDYITEVGSEEFARQPIGSGPFRFVEWVRDDHLSFEANEDYWRGAPQADSVTFRPIPEPSTRIAALLSGEVDIIEQVNFTDIPLIERSDGVRVEAVQDNRIYFYAINSSEPPFDDVRVRRALTHAIDWDTVLSIYDGYASRVAVPATPNDFGYSSYIDDISHLIPGYDPELARELLAEAGYPDGFATTIETPLNRYPKDAELAQAVAAQLSEVGIDASVEASEWGIYYGEVWPGNIKGIGFFSMGNPLFDPDQIFTIHFDPEGSSRYYNDPALTELGNRGRITVDGDERAAIYGEFMTHVLTEVPYLFTHGVQQVYGVREGMNWTPRADNRIFADEITFE